jgi:hypothetical protein
MVRWNPASAVSSGCFIRQWCFDVITGSSGIRIESGLKVEVGPAANNVRFDYNDGRSYYFGGPLIVWKRR